MLNTIKWDILWRLSPILERLGLIVASRERWDRLMEIEYDYYYLKHQLQRTEAKLEAAGISDDPAYEDCPFCPLTGIEGQRPATSDDFIGGVRSCAVCSWVAEHCAIEGELVEGLREKQEQKAIEVEA